jgi:predicted GTPase
MVLCDLVLSATPIDIALLLKIEKSVVRMFYNLSEPGGKPLAELIARFAGAVARRQGTVF